MKSNNEVKVIHSVCVWLPHSVIAHQRPLHPLAKLDNIFHCILTSKRKVSTRKKNSEKYGRTAAVYPGPLATTD